ncbi:MAG: TRAP transporter small permease [Kiloniellales bacterium]
MKAVAWAVTWLTKLSLYAAALIGAVMSTIVFVAVALRYVFHSPLPFTDEIVGLFFSAVVFLAIPYLFAGDRNIKVAMVVERLSPRWRSGVQFFSNLGIIVFFLLLGWLSFDFAAFSFAISARTDVAQLPVGPWMALLPLSSFLTALVVLVKTAFAPFGVEVGERQERLEETLSE